MNLEEKSAHDLVQFHFLLLKYQVLSSLYHLPHHPTFSFSLYLRWDMGNELDLVLLQIQQLKYDLEVSVDGVLSMPLLLPFH